MKKENKNRCLERYLGTMDRKGTMCEWDGTKRYKVVKGIHVAED